MARTLSGAIGMIVCLAVFSSELLGQQSNTYAEEYDLYQMAQQEQNAAQQVALIMEFVQRYKSSQLDSHVSYLYSQHLQAYRQRGDWNGLAGAAEKFLQYRPGDQTAAALATEAYQKLGQPQKLVEFGTRLYNQKPNAQAAYLVAKAYKSMNDTANFEKWAERTLRHAPNNAEMLIELVNSAWASQDLAKASELGQKAIKALEGSPDDAATNRFRAFCHRAVGENAYRNGDFDTAQRQFELAVKMDPMVDFGHHRLAYCYWQSGQVDQAIQSFAKAIALGGSSSKEARREFHTLLVQKYGSAASATKFIDAAKQELGL